jgi:hypothetical protein
MTGLWEGTYAYPGHQGPTTPFVARIAEEGGALTGSILEPNTIGFSSEELQSALNGAREGEAVDFIKTYDGASDAAHAVDYVGRLSPDGNLVTGVWSLAEFDGTFEMRREATWEELLTAEEEAPAPAETALAPELPTPDLG